LQKVALRKAAAPVKNPAMSDKDLDEAAPPSISDIEANITSRQSAEAA
jgi:hypothetical protein